MGGVRRQQADRESCGSLVCKISLAAAPTLSGFQPFIPGQNKRGLSVMGTISVVAKVSHTGREIIAYIFCLIFFYIYQKTHCL